MSDPPRTLYVTVADQPWRESRPGIQSKVLWEEGDRRAVLIRYGAGSIVPRHRHVGDEQVFVIEGSVSDDTGTVTAGNYARRPPGCVHTVTSNQGALVLAIMTGGGTVPLA